MLILPIIKYKVKYASLKLDVKMEPHVEPVLDAWVQLVLVTRHYCECGGLVQCLPDRTHSSWSEVRDQVVALFFNFLYLTTSMYIIIWSDDGQARAILAGASDGGDSGQRSVGPGQRSGAKRSVLLNRLQASVYLDRFDTGSHYNV